MAESFFATPECELIVEALHIREHRVPPPRREHGSPTAGVCVAGATPPVKNPAAVLIETAWNQS